MSDKHAKAAAQFAEAAERAAQAARIAELLAENERLRDENEALAKVIDVLQEQVAIEKLRGSVVKFEMFGFVFAHVDQCAECLTGQFCKEGKALIDRAAQLGAEMLVPGYPIEKPKAQA